MKIELKDIDPNPHRDMKTNPVNEEQVTGLKDSMARNGVWPNIVVRKHPEKAGRYQLAYGHHRLAAMREMGMREANFAVQTISDWDMYQAMVDENETQKDITPAILMENVKAGLDLLVPIIATCETLEEYRKKVPEQNQYVTTGPRGPVGSNCREEDYVKVRNVLLEKGTIGSQFLQRELPGKKSSKRHHMAPIVEAYFNDRQTQDAIRAAIKHEEEARQAEEEERAAKTEADKETARQKKEYAAKRAAKRRAEVSRLSKQGTDSAALLKFTYASTMAAFHEAMRRERIPKNLHVRAAEAAVREGWSQKRMPAEAQRWALYNTPAGKKRIAQEAAEAHHRKFKKVWKIRNQSFQLYAQGVVAEVRAMHGRLEKMAGYMEHVETAMFLNELKTQFTKTADLLDKLIEEIDAVDNSAPAASKSNPQLPKPQLKVLK